MDVVSQLPAHNYSLPHDGRWPAAGSVRGCPAGCPTRIAFADARLHIDTDNEFALVIGYNNEWEVAKRHPYVRLARRVAEREMKFVTKQQAYRFAAWLLHRADSVLPDEEESYSFEIIRDAIEFDK